MNRAVALHLAKEIVDLAERHAQLLATVASLRKLNLDASAVVRDARFTAAFIGDRAYALGYDIVTVRTAKRMARETIKYLERDRTLRVPAEDAERVA